MCGPPFYRRAAILRGMKRAFALLIAMLLYCVFLCVLGLAATGAIWFSQWAFGPWESGWLFLIPPLIFLASVALSVVVTRWIVGSGSPA